MRVDSGHARRRAQAGSARPGRRSRGRPEHGRRGRWDRAGSFAASGLALAALAGALAGCGSSGSTGTSADPAGVVPAAAPIYIGAVVRPAGALETDALTVGRKLTHQADAYTRLVALLQTPGSPALEYRRDIAPWLGPNAGIFFTSLGSSSSLERLLGQALSAGSAGAGTSGAAGAWPFGTGAAGGAQGAIVLDTSDLAKARSFVAGAAAHAGAHASSYRGVAYRATSAGDAFAVVDRLVVLGTEAALHAVIDTAQGGASLKSDATYSRLASVAPAGALAHVYADPGALPNAQATAGGRSLPVLLSVLGGARPLDVSLVPSSDSIALDADIGPPPAGGASGASGLVGAAATGSRAFGELPGESWLAAGFGETGAGNGEELEGLKGLLSLLGALGGSAAAEAASTSQATLSVKGVIEGMFAPLRVLGANSAEARRDFLSWMGEAGMFASGTTVIDLKAAIVIASRNAAASRAAVAKLAAGLRRAGGEATQATIQGTEAAVEAKVSGLPVTLAIADGRDSAGQAKFVIGLSSTSVQDALSPSSTMSSSTAFGAAESALGEGIRPSIAVDVASLLSLLEGFGLSEDPSVSGLVPYMRASTTLSGGGRSLGGGIQRLRLVLGLQPAAG